MTVESLTVDGIDLSSRCFMLGDSSGIMGTPPLRGENITIPARHGELQRPNKMYDASELVLNLSVAGSLADGSIPIGSDPVKEFFKRRDELVSIFHKPTVTLVHTLPDGSQRKALCEISNVMPWNRPAYSDSADVSVSLKVLGAFWQDVSPVTQTFTVSSGNPVALTAFQGATAPMTDLTLVFGAGSNPTLAQSTTFFTYGEVITAGRQLQVNCSDGTLGIGTGSAWTPSLSKISYDPGPPYFILDPKFPMSVILNNTHGGSMTCTISGYRKYLTS